MAKLFSTVLFLIASLVFQLGLSGCAGEGGGKTNISSTVGDVSTESSGKGRYDAWASVEGKKPTVIKEIEETEQKKIDLEIAKANQVHVVLDTPEKINAWNNAQATRDLGEVAKNLSKDQSQNKYGAYFTPTPIPKSAFAEGVEAVGNVAVRVVESPTALAGTTAYMVGSAVRGAKGGTTVTATDKAQVTVNQATATGQSKATVNNGSSSSGTKEASAKVTASQWQDCTTTANGAATVDEINSCMIDYGYETSVKDGVLYLDGMPYSGPATEGA